MSPLTGSDSALCHIVNLLKYDMNKEKMSHPKLRKYIYMQYMSSGKV